MWPREHGSIVMVSAAFLVGAGLGWPAGGNGIDGWALLAMALAVTGVFLLRRPLAILVSRPPRRTCRRAYVWTLLFGVPAVAGAALVLVTLPLAPLVALGAASAPVYVAATMAVRLRAERALWMEIAGVVGAALTAPAAFLAAHGRLDPLAFQAFIACSLFFAGGLLHVRSLFHRRRPRAGRADLAAALPPVAWTLLAAASALLLVVAGLLAPGLGIAAATAALLRPIVHRGAIAARAMRVGLAETGLAIVFVVTLVVWP